MKVNLERLSEYPIVCIDCETTGLHWYKDKMFSVAIAAWDGENIHSQYIDIRDEPSKIETLAGEAPNIKKYINHNAKFDSHFLREAGIDLPLDRIECTSVRAALINEHEPSFSLDALGRKYVNHGKVDIYEELAKMFGGQPTRAAQMKNLYRAPASLAGRYAIDDPVIAIKLWLWQEEEIKRQGLEQVWGIERQLTPILVQMEKWGVRVDEERAENSLGTIDKQVRTTQNELDSLTGRSINVNSSPQMRVLFGAHKVEAETPKGYLWKTDSGIILPMTDGGEASIGKDSLITLSGLGDKRAQHALAIRKMVKAKSFLKDHIIGHAIDGRVYPNYNQTRGDNQLGTGTGRFSIDDPALQQIPARDKEIAEVVRSCFLPEEGHQWTCGDWAQFEFRVFAHYTKDPNVLRIYEENPDADYHQVVADITGIPRNPRYAGDANAKQINLGLVFGMGQGKMAYEMGLEHTVEYRQDREWYKAGPGAVEVFNKYHGALPAVKKLLDQASSVARSRGYVTTILGRHIRFPGGKAVHKAAGLVFQGTSADSMKQKMIELFPVCKAEGINMLLSVHDELDFSTPTKETPRQKILLKKHLESFGSSDPIQFRVPIRSSVESGDNWFIASK